MMQQSAASRHLGMPACRRKDLISAGLRPRHTPTTSALPDQVRSTWVPQQHQMVSGTAGRIALDGYSWMQAVHWVHGAGLYVPTHGPKFGETTLRLAEVLSTLTPCRPSIAHLMRKLKCSRRTVQYHLEILRSTGLLAWRSIGTRLPMMPGQARVESHASEYERLIPRTYDRALGIRTAGEGLGRRMTGISDEGRSVIAELGKKASRRARRTVRHTSGRRAVSTPRCTPMEVGTTDCLSSPSVGDSKATGIARVEKSITKRKQSSRPAEARRRTVLGQVVTAAMMAAGDQLAQVAYRRVPWVRQASHDQLRWVLNDAAARGWDEQRTVSWLSEIAGQYAGAGLLWRPERPHALIAHALRQEADQEQHDRQVAADAAARVEDISVAAVRELVGEMEVLADLLGEAAAATATPGTGQDLQEAFLFPAEAAARMELAGDDAADLFGIDLVARYAGLAANPRIQLGVTR
ncbi:hypothetical protein AB0442_39885 [Kitasatospora sp. NPDC085895]|uniref:hypothetical protein n=1 Tax=Kitasatospora sp. NPDC085895 TaxID=3155057 RepID=UPI00344D56D9